MRNKTVAAGAALILAAGCGGTPEPEMDNNPFFTESTLPYGLPAFDLIEDSHYRAAFERGMAEQIEEVEAIASSPEPATLDNTLVAMERSGRLLDRVARVFFSLASADTNDEINAIRAEMAPKLAAHSDQILLNADLFARVEALFEGREAAGLSPEEVRLVEQYRRDFTRAGAQLSEPEKERMREINAEVASLSAAFSDNTLNEVNASAVVVDTAEELAGLSEGEIAAAAEAAKGARPRGQVRDRPPEHQRPAGAVIARRPRAAGADREHLAHAGQSRGGTRQPRGDREDRGAPRRARRAPRLPAPRRLCPLRSRRRRPSRP